MFKIKTYNSISKQGLDHFDSNKYQVSPDIERPDAILLRSQNLHDLPFDASLQAVARAGAGVNNIPIDDLSQLGIPVFNTPGANANAVKELVLAAMLLACRNILPAWDYTRNLSGDEESLNTEVEKGKKQFVGFELPNRTLAVIGLGAIGVKVANAASALGMKVVGFDPGITIARAWELSSDVKKAQSITEAITQADFISLHVPFIDQTKHLINKPLFDAMKPGVVLINCARGGIVDENALLPAISDDIVRAYVTDFPSNTLKDHDRILMLPHLGASTGEAEDNCAIMAAQELSEFLENGTIRNSVNFPEVSLPRNGGFRLAIANANIPNMVGQISTELAEHDLNILDMLNKSRGDLAYTLVDTDKAIPASLLTKLRSIQGVLKVNVLP